MERDLANQQVWYFDSEPPAGETFSILAAPPTLECIAEHVPTKPIAHLMSAAPQLLTQLKRCRPFVVDRPEILRDVDRAIAWAEGHPGPLPDYEQAVARPEATTIEATETSNVLDFKRS
jgi:hypothetical protein